MNVIRGAELKALMAQWRKEGLSPDGPVRNPAVAAMLKRARRAFLPPPTLHVVK